MTLCAKNCEWKYPYMLSLHWCWNRFPSEPEFPVASSKGQTLRTQCTASGPPGTTQNTLSRLHVPWSHTLSNTSIHCMYSDYLASHIKNAPLVLPGTTQKFTLAGLTGTKEKQKQKIHHRDHLESQQTKIHYPIQTIRKHTKEVKEVHSIRAGLLKNKTKKNTNTQTNKQINKQTNK